MNPKEIGIVWFLLRFGVAFTFLFASISAFMHPSTWLAWFPDFLRHSMSDTALLYLWGSAEIVIGLWILSGKHIFIPSIAAAGLMLGIFIFDFSSIHVIFRNVCILSTSIALAVMTNPYYRFHLVHEGTTATEIHTPVGDKV